MTTIKKWADRLSSAFVSRMARQPVPWGPLGYVTYKRTYSRLREDLGRTEEYHSTVERSVNAILEYGGRFTTSEAELLYEYIYTLKCSPPGRMFWQLGTPTVARIGGASCCNCFYINVSDLESFCFTFDMLMLGGGVGFGVSPADVFTLPKVLGPVKVVRRDSNDVDFIVPDNREGWVELLRRVLHAYFITGRSFTYSVHCVRGKGERIKGFGGVASGPGELVKGMSQICGVLDARVGKKIRPVDALDVMNIIGSIVVSGNVRRSAQIAVGSPKDIDYLQAKMWSRGSIPNWRNNSNNTVRADDVSELGESFWDGYSVDENGNAKGENYGLFNPALSRSHGRLIDGAGYRPDHKADGPNPCVTADTWVLTQDGPKQVSDLIGKPFVATVDGQSYPSTDRGFYATGTKPVFRVRTAGGYEFKATDNHQVLTVSKLTSKVRQTEWKTVGELKPGDRLALHNHRGNEFSGAGTFDQGWLVGNLLGDGTFCEHKGRLTAKLCYWGEHRSSMLEQARRMIRESVGARADCGTQGGDTVLDTQRKQRVLGSRKLMSLAARFGVGRDKVVGVAAEKSSSVFHRGFLQGWFDADGMIIGDQQKGVSARLTSIHLPNLQAAQRMLARLGVISTIYTGRQKAGSRPLPDGRGGMAMYECQESHELVVARDNLALFAELVGFSDPSKKAKLEQLVGGYKRALNRERFTAVVETVEPAGDESVYDCTVPGPSCFDGNGVVLHNCAEQTLEDGECCDLYELYLPRLKTREEFVTAARFGYKVCKTVLQLPFAWTKTQEVVLRNQRMGIGVSGYCEAGHFDKDDYTAAYRAVEELDVDYSREIKANRSIKLTTVKPSGTVSLLPGVTPGVHPAYSRYYIRRIRFSADDPIVAACRKNGYHVEPKVEFDGSQDHSTQIVSFPVDVGPDTVTASQVSATKQMDMQRFLQTYWSDNAVSVTVYYRDEELPAIREKLTAEYRNGIKTISFTKHSNHGYRQAPYEEISRQQYDELNARCRPITGLDDAHQWDIVDSLECAGGACPVR